MKILLAVSGGIDSMYLANRAALPDGPFASYPGPHEFAVAHCNFSLRGEESDADEEFVRRWCGEHGMEFFTIRFDTPAYADSKGLSTEMAARELRYGWFAEIIRTRGFDALAVAHNANDNAETLFLNLLRGTGARGLRGMAEDSENGIRILRPMLKTERKEIERWMLEKGLEWREDRTNAESLYKRNILRNDVFPILSRLNPSFIRTLEEDMQRFALVDDIADGYYMECMAQVRKGEPLPVDLLLSLKHWKYVLWRYLEKAGISYPTFGKMKELLERYRTEPRGTVTICGKSFEGQNKLIAIERHPSEGAVIRIAPRPE